MATITDFRELKCWQEARSLAKDVYALTAVGPFAKDYGLKDQIQRAVVSIGSNIADGFERDSNAELVKFIGYAKGSAGEVISQMYTAYDIGFISEDALLSLTERLRKLGAMLAKFRATLKSSSHKGLYYK